MPEIKITMADADRVERQRAFLRALYHHRPCAICAQKTWCQHREPEVDLAAHGARQNSDVKKERYNDAV
jgi:hypothetical protein